LTLGPFWKRKVYTQTRKNIFAQAITRNARASNLMHFSLQIGNKGSVDITATAFHVGCYSRERKDKIVL
jgi:hypothetical protein